jgi:pimeloyl-ACP methyl ester carboxylesterase
LGSDPDRLPPLLPERGAIDVEDCAVRWYAGGAGDPTLVLVHGGGAHAGWWEPVIGALSARQRVVAIDLSGHGDSGHRPNGYPSKIWVTEVGALLREVVDGPAAVVGHSLGGRIGTTTAALYPDLVTALVTLDSVIPPYGGEPIPRVGSRKAYETKEIALKAFRLMPPQPPVEPEIMDRLARRSITQLPDGRYTWKFDPAIFGQMVDRFGVARDIPSIRCPVTIVQGALSELTSPALAGQYQELLGRGVETVTFADSYHHIPLDAPAETVALLGRLEGTRPR